MIRDEIKKYIAYSSILRQRIKETKSERTKKALIKELVDVYDKLEFWRNLNDAMYKQGGYNEKRK